MSHVFYKGFAAGVISTLPAGTHIKLLVDFNTEPTELHVGDEIFTMGKTIDPLVAEVFQVGDLVDRVPGTFRGTVTGFEYHTNRAVCVSQAIGKYQEDRTRYAYAVSELKKFDPQHFVFEKAATYLLNGVVSAMAVESVFSNSEIMLFATDNGRMIYRDVAIQNSLPNLRDKHYITEIKKL